MLNDYEKYTIGEYFRREGKKENARESRLLPSRDFLFPHK